MARRTTDSLIFDTLRLEGGLFVPAVLEKAARGEHTAQKAADYRLPKGLALVDEQGRAFRIASALQKTFEPTRARTDVSAARATIGFVTELLRDALGYSDLTLCTEPVTLADRAYPVTAFAVGGRLPVIIAPHNLELDEPDERFAIVGSGARRRSAYQLAQQFLNASAPCTWAILTNGRQLRLVRDADTLTRPAFLEADLDLILRAQRYPDFTAVWRLFHASRAGAPDASGESYPWESWKKEGQEQGQRVREGLRTGVTEALLALGTGFIEHPANETLRLRLQNGDLVVNDYFQQLLRLVYRCLFVFTVEERTADGLPILHVRDDSPGARRAREAYAAGYAFRRLRDRALRRAGFDRNHDLWTGVQVVFKGLAYGEARLALPALGGLFAPTQCPDLDSARLENRSLLAAMRELRWSRHGGSLAAIDYRNMGSEELGSVYESLLELVPTVDLSARRFGFVGMTDSGSTDGNARKTTGSYYTPEDPVQELLKSALEPVIAQKLDANPADPARALLEISVVDIACGSGHFLLAAARRLAEKLAELRAVDGAVIPDDYRHALREVIAHCIYGVDRNPMALELARTALWLEGYEPGQPLSFLDHHLVCGDALLGLIDFQMLAKGIPPDAFDPLAGDSKTIAKALSVENRAALKDIAKRAQGPELFAQTDTTDLLAELRQLEALPEANPLEVEIKAAAYATFLKHARDSRLAQAADLVVAAFLAPKATEADRARCPTTQTLADLLFPRQGSAVPAETIAYARDLCREARVLHWPLAFAAIFARGGFDCVLGNPPWERIKLQEEEFFASKEPLIAVAKNKAERSQRIQWLSEGSLHYHLQQADIPHGGNPTEIKLHREFIVARRVAEAMSVFAHVSGTDAGRYPLTGVGDVNTYALFSETISRVTNPTGRAGFIVPTGIATDDSTKDFFAHIAEAGKIACLYDFENREKIFPAVDSRMKFCLLTLGPADVAEFAFFLTRTEQLQDERRRFRLSRSDFKLLNPNTRTCPVFRSQADAELTKKIYHRVPILVTEERDEAPEINPWGIRIRQGLFHLTNDINAGIVRDVSAGYSAESQDMAVWEGKFLHQFDHRWATYQWDSARGERGEFNTVDTPLERKADAAFSVNPRYWVNERYVLARLAKAPRCVTRAWESADPQALLYAVATWIKAGHEQDALAGFSGQSTRDRIIATGGKLFEALPSRAEDWLKEKDEEEAQGWPALHEFEISRLQSATDLNKAGRFILDHRSPRWLIGWRDITNATNERTVLGAIMPRNGVAYTVRVVTDLDCKADAAACLLANLNSIVLDYVARQSMGGTHLSDYITKQLPILTPKDYSAADMAYIVPRVLELTYTSDDLAPWAAEFGYTGKPFAYDPDRRAKLRAELDAYYARLYGLDRDELRFILDPTDTHGADYPTVTFPGLRRNEESEHGEYRTRRLVLESWDAQTPKPTIAPATVPLAPRVPYLAKDITHYFNFLVYGWGQRNADLRVMVRAFTLLQFPQRISSRLHDAEPGAKEWLKSFREPIAGHTLRPILEALIDRKAVFLVPRPSGGFELKLSDTARSMKVPGPVMQDVDFSLRAAAIELSKEPPLSPTETTEFEHLRSLAASF